MESTMNGSSLTQTNSPTPAPTPIKKKLTKEELLAKFTELEAKADVYSRTDWDAYNSVKDQLANLDKLLLDIYNEESETFLQSHSIA